MRLIMRRGDAPDTYKKGNLKYLSVPKEALRTVTFKSSTDE